LIGYIIFRVGLLIQFSSYIFVTIFWLRNTADARAVASETNSIFSLLTSILSALVVLLTVVTIIEILVLCLTYGDVIDYTNKSKVYQCHVYFEGFAWSVHGILVFVCAGMVSERLKKITAFREMSTTQQIKLMISKLSPMITCALCYLLRGIWITVDLIITVTTESTNSASRLYWICAVWIAISTPSMVLLFELRARDKIPEWMNGSDTSTLPSPPPPEVIFAMLRNTLDGDTEETDTEPFLNNSAEELLNDFESRWRPLAVV